MNDKIKRFSFGAENAKAGRGKRYRQKRPELVILSIEDRKHNGKTRREIIISIHERLFEQTSWAVKDRIEFTVQGEGLTEGVLHTAPSGYLINPTSGSASSRMLIRVPAPPDMERFFAPQAMSECKNVECKDGIIAFDMPW